MTLSAATPAVKTDGETPRASEIAMQLTATVIKKQANLSVMVLDLVKSAYVEKEHPGH